MHLTSVLSAATLFSAAVFAASGEKEQLERLHHHKPSISPINSTSTSFTTSTSLLFPSSSSTLLTPFASSTISSVCPTAFISYSTVVVEVTSTTFVSTSASWFNSTIVPVATMSKNYTENATTTAFVPTTKSSGFSTAYKNSSSSTLIWGVNTTSAGFTTVNSKNCSSTFSFSSSLTSSVPKSTLTPPNLTLTPTPATIATGTQLRYPSTSMVPTTTVTGTPPNGTPNPKAVHCGLHGLPDGDFFLAEFDYEGGGEDVTLEKCFDFCASVYGIDMGCLSYQFYPEPGTDAPRCDLYSGSVAQSLESVDAYVPNLWFDLACGVPFDGW